MKRVASVSLAVNDPAALRQRAAQIPARLAPEDLIELWNCLALAVGLPECRGLNVARRTAARNLLKDHPERDYWIQVMKHIGLSAFCRGHNDRGWQANIDFLLRRSTHLKALEGFYDNKPSGGTGGGAPPGPTDKYWGR